MLYERGRVVRSTAGRDKGYFLVVLEDLGDSVILCDGKERPLERPKKKNMKHVSKTDLILEDVQIKTNRAIRHSLHCNVCIANSRKEDE